MAAEANAATAQAEGDKPERVREFLNEWDSSPAGKHSAAESKSANGEAKSEGLPPEALEAEPGDKPDLIEEYERRIAELEDGGKKLSAELQESRADSQYMERVIEVADRFDYDRGIDRLEAETSLDRASAEARFKLWLLENPEILAAADRRGESDDYGNLFDEFVEELAEAHPKGRDHNGLRVAILSARSASSSHSSSGDYENFGRMSDQQLDTVKRQVFSNVKAGRFKASRGRGFFSVEP